MHAYTLDLDVGILYYDTLIHTIYNKILIYSNIVKY